MRQSVPFRVPLYKTTFLVAAGGEPPEGLRPDSEAGFGTGPVPFLWFRGSDPPPGLVAHECLHAAVWLLEERVGTTLQTKERFWEEILCYPLEFMVAEVVKCLAKLRKRE